MRNYKEYLRNLPASQAYILLVVFLLVYETILYTTVGLHQAVWGDERHFVQTIQQFGQEISLTQLKTYNEMSTPLPFVLYALWGKIAGFQLHQLRLFSLLIAFFTFLIFFRLYQETSSKSSLALLMTLFVIFQPYMIGLTIFVFTDMLPLLFLGLSLWAFQRNNPYLLAFSLGSALLCRQYYIFLPAAVGIYFCFRFFISRNRTAARMVLASVISLIPLGLLFLLWGGFSPQNDMRQLYLHESLHFHPDYLILYISLFIVYLLPLIIYRWKTYYRDKKILLFSLLLSAFYFLFPIKASAYSMAIQVYTVGFFHKFLRSIMGSSLEHFIFYLTFLFSLPVLLTILIDIYQKLKNKITDGLLLANLCIFFFLVAMPFSYLNWEKYFLPVIPLAVFSILNKKYFHFFGIENIPAISSSD